ncbi:MAG: hydroxymethylbilane synthase [Solirubrobacterales bacterium]
MSPRLLLGTRGSALALAQAGTVSRALGGAEIVTVKTADGDVGDKARFVRGVEDALLAGEVDVAVHSAKDLPGELPDGLELIAVPGREDPADAFIGPAGSLEEVPEGARIGTASLRRRSQLLALRPDIEVVELRGNIDTRLAKLAAGECDGIVLAVAGLRRLGRAEEIAFAFTSEQMTPAPGQGCLALETRAGDEGSRYAASQLGDRAATIELIAERAATAALGATCDTPVGVLGRASGDSLRLEGYAGAPDGGDWVRDSVKGEGDAAAELGALLAERMLAAGAAEILSGL